MNRRIAVIVVCALVLSVCVSFLVYRAVGTKSSAPHAVKTIPVIVAARDLAVGSLIRDADLKTISWSWSGAERALIGKPDTVRNRGVAAPIYEGEPITGNPACPSGLRRRIGGNDSERNARCAR